MIKSDLSNYVLFNRYAEANRKNVIKLLLRAKLLYNSQIAVSAIFKHIVELEEIMKPKGVLWRIIQDETDNELDDTQTAIINRTLNLLSRVLSLLAIFQNEHRVFDGEFSFGRADYRHSLRNWGLVIGGFLYKKQLKNPSLLLSGLLLDDHQETNDQIHAYKNWFEKSIEMTGKAEVDSSKQMMAAKVLNMILVKEKSFKKSKIDGKLSMLPPIRQATPLKKRVRP